MQSPSDVIPGHSLQPRLRVFSGDHMVLGWGKILLLQQVRECGSIAEAARQLGMSYNHAWTLIRTMNANFQSPLVEAIRGGGGKGGGALITATGEQVLHLYQSMVEECQKATQSHWAALQHLLQKPTDPS